MRDKYLFRPKDLTLLDKIRKEAEKQDLTIRQYIERALQKALKAHR